VDRVDHKVAVGRVQLEAFVAHGAPVVAAGHKDDLLLACARKQAAIVAADAAGADHRELHGGRSVLVSGCTLVPQSKRRLYLLSWL